MRHTPQLFHHVQRSVRGNGEEGIATKHSDEIFLNSDGDPTDEKSARGLPTKYTMQHPEKLIFVDEVGSNASTTKDGNVGGEKFLCETDAQPQMKAVTKDSHFTVLGFTTATGVPLLCSIIFSEKELDEKCVFEFDASAPWAVDDDSVIGNSGLSWKTFSYGTSVQLNGIEVPTLLRLRKWKHHRRLTGPDACSNR